MSIEISEVAAIRAIGSHLLRAQFYKAHYGTSAEYRLYKEEAEEVLRQARKLNDALPADNKMTVPESFEALQVNAIWPPAIWPIRM